MHADKQKEILMNCIDKAVLEECVQGRKYKEELAQNLIDMLADYPKPQKKHEPTGTTPQYLGAYLYVSTARNSVKLAQIGYMPFNKAFSVANSCFEAALSLLIDND